MRGIYWVGLTALATLGGVYLHSEEVQDAVAASEFAIGQNGPTFEEEMAALEPRIANGEIDRRRAVDIAINRTIERASSGDTASVSFTIGGDGDGTGYAEAIDEARARIDNSKDVLAQLRADGTISQERYSELIADLSIAEDSLEAID